MLNKAKENNVWLKKSFSLVEIILTTAIFGLIITSAMGSIVYSKQTSFLAGKHNRAVFLAEEGLEVVRNMRDQDFANLLDGTYGLVIVGNQWVFDGTYDNSDGFSRSITISTIDENTKSLISDVIWQQNLQRSGQVTLQTYLSNWQAEIQTGPQADYLLVDVSTAYVGQASNQVYDVNFENLGNFPITIDKVTVSWTDTKRDIEEIVFDNSIVWTLNGPGTPLGKQSSGTEIDIVDFTLPALSGLITNNTFKFEGNIKDNVFDFIFTMSDGTQKIIEGVAPAS